MTRFALLRIESSRIEERLKWRAVCDVSGRESANIAHEVKN